MSRTPHVPQRLTKRAFAEAVATELGITPEEGERVLTGVLNVITRAVVRGDSVMVTNFGTFRRVRRERRSARNPQTGGRVTVPARNVVDFRVAPRFAALVRDGRRTRTASISKRVTSRTASIR
ncbi:hypothetical protein ADL21_11310 [Streptomyces albus subsp. albus]|nr:hypothetical protein ADL21_11310 [Streptomyces albus subsp. albus]